MGEKEEDRGFVVKDRRRVSMEGAEAEPAAPVGESAQKQEEKAPGREPDQASMEEEARHIPMPAVTLATFVWSLSSSALVHLGEVPDPMSQEVRVDLPLAKQVIDTLGMLQEKTKGNLDAEEDRLLKTLLYDLRLRYVQKSGK